MCAVGHQTVASQVFQAIVSVHMSCGMPLHSKGLRGVHCGQLTLSTFQRRRTWLSSHPRLNVNRPRVECRNKDMNGKRMQMQTN